MIISEAIESSGCNRLQQRSFDPGRVDFGIWIKGGSCHKVTIKLRSRVYCGRVSDRYLPNEDSSPPEVLYWRMLHAILL